MPSAADRDALRRLAERYAAMTASERNRELQRRWRAHNALRGGPPLVLCDPEGAWSEILGGWAECSDQHSLIADRSLRWLEWQMRNKLYAHEVLREDRAWSPWIDVPWVWDAGSWGIDVPHEHGADRGSYTWTPPLADFDFSRLRQRVPSVDHEASLRRLAEVQALVGDLVPCRLRCFLWWTDGLTIDIIKLIGLERLMTAMLDQPDELHAAMAWLRDDRLQWIRAMEALGILNPRNEGDGIGSGGQGWTDELPQADHTAGMPYRLIDGWGFAESQETVGVSPRHFAQFILPYQAPILAHYGLNCYGCCEGLDKRIDHVLAQVPRLRRVSVSPWANEMVMAAKLRGRAIYSRKPNPAHVCVGFDETAIRADLRGTLAAAWDCQLEIILKDTHTVEGRPERLARWVEIAREEIERRAQHGADAQAVLAR